VVTAATNESRHNSESRAVSNQNKKNCMLEEKRLQWQIAWTKRKLSSLVNFWILVILVVSVVASQQMGYSVRKKYARDYIPFDTVLRRNFILSEQVIDLDKALKNSYEQNQRNEELLAEFQNYKCMMESQIKEYQEIVETNKEKVATFENIVYSFEEDRSETRKVRQENIRLTMALKESQEECKELAVELTSMNMNNRSKECVLSITNGAEANTQEKQEAVTDMKSAESTSDLSREGNETKLKEYKSQEVEDETVLHKHETKKVEYSYSEMSDIGSYEEESNSSESDASDQSEVCKSQEDLDFIEEDGIIFMFVSGCSMTRQYILLEEEEDKNWFPKTQVYEAVDKFINQPHQIVGVKQDAQRRSKLNIILEGLRRGMVDNVITDEFLNFAFMSFYEAREGSV